MQTISGAIQQHGSPGRDCVRRSDRGVPDRVPRSRWESLQSPPSLILPARITAELLIGLSEVRSPSLRASVEVIDNRGGSRPHVRRRAFAHRHAACAVVPARTIRRRASNQLLTAGLDGFFPSAHRARCRCGRASSSSIARTPAPAPTSNGRAAPSPSGSASLRPRQPPPPTSPAARGEDARPGESRPMGGARVLVVSKEALAARLSPCRSPAEHAREPINRPETGPTASRRAKVAHTLLVAAAGVPLSRGRLHGGGAGWALRPASAA